MDRTQEKLNASIDRNTFSICNQCYKKIPAKIYSEDGLVKITKSCCNMIQEKTIEKNIAFYKSLFRLNYINILGNSCILPITYRCNTSCRACYSKIRNQESDVSEIISLTHCTPTWITKFLLTGGEPTTHPKFLDIVSQLDCGVITNGIKFSDFNFLKEFARFKVYRNQFDNEIALMFSLNTKGSPDYEKKLEAIENVKRMGLKLYMVCATIVDLQEIPDVLNEFKKIKDVVSWFKIRSAFNIGESSGFEDIYLSEMVDCVLKHSKVFRFLENLNNNSYLINTRCDDINLILVKCPDKTSLDLCDIGPTGPYQLTHLNTFEDVMVALIINEGIEKGYFNGLKIEG
jgi:uncharacterized radical SAM superfamily Fe-S cluster-containing enzyme